MQDQIWTCIIETFYNEQQSLKVSAFYGTIWMQVGLAFIILTRNTANGVFFGKLNNNAKARFPVNGAKKQCFSKVKMFLRNLHSFHIHQS